MKLIEFFTLITLSFFSTTVLAGNEMADNLSVALQSRNMPRSCEFVFEVESDIKLILGKDVKDQSIFYQFGNSWAPFNWTNEKEAKLTIASDKKEFNLTLLSMSLPSNYLYRHIKIRFPESKVTCISEFGREFGEVCMPEGRSATPWRLRVLTCDTLE